MIIDLPPISGSGDAAVDAAIETWRLAIMAALNLRFTGNCVVDDYGSGQSVYIKGLPVVSVSGVVQSGGITAAPDANTLGQGNVKIRNRENAALSDGEIVKCYSNFSVAVPSGKRIEMTFDGLDYKLNGADC